MSKGLKKDIHDHLRNIIVVNFVIISSQTKKEQPFVPTITEKKKLGISKIRPLQFENKKLECLLILHSQTTKL